MAEDIETDQDMLAALDKLFVKYRTEKKRDNELTIDEIAGRYNMKHETCRVTVAKMVEEGKLVKREAVSQNGRLVTVYSVAE